MCFSTDIIHSAHIAMVKRASRLGKLTIGVLSDEAVASYKRYPLLPFEERRTMFANIKGVERAVEQRQLSYRENILKYRPDIVVHGDDWTEGFQKPIRDEVKKAYPQIGEVHISSLGVVIGAHCGPGLLAAFYLCGGRSPD